MVGHYMVGEITTGVNAWGAKASRYSPGTRYSPYILASLINLKKARGQWGNATGLNVDAQ
jgi:hypothetical protein